MFTPKEFSVFSFNTSSQAVPVKKFKLIVIVIGNQSHPLIKYLVCNNHSNYKLVTVRGHTKRLTNKRRVIEKLQLLEVQKTVKMPFLTM